MPEVQYFWPRIRHESGPWACAVVVMLWVLVPASGSVIANAMRFVPSATPESQVSFCSGEACAASSVPAMVGEMTSMNIGQPAAEVSSMTTARSASPPPPPPWASGRCTPR